MEPEYGMSHVAESSDFCPQLSLGLLLLEKFKVLCLISPSSQGCSASQPSESPGGQLKHRSPGAPLRSSDSVGLGKG